MPETYTKEQFHEIVRKAVKPDPENRLRIIASSFDTSMSAVRRWANGTSCPHELFFSKVVDFIRKTWPE